MIEVWKPINGWEGSYEVSNLGNTRSLDRIVDFNFKGTTYPRKIQGRPLKPVLTGGYFVVTLKESSRKVTARIHIEVAKAFIPNPYSLPNVLHGPNGSQDNSVLNLRWGTQSENIADQVADGTHRNSRKTHCPRNHPYDDQNTRLVSVKGDAKVRRCLKCLAALQAYYMGRKPHPDLRNDL